MKVLAENKCIAKQFLTSAAFERDAIQLNQLPLRGFFNPNETSFALLILFLTAAVTLKAEEPLVLYVNPFLGTAPITNVADIGFVPPWRVWADLTLPGASLPNALVLLSPITKFGSGAAA